MKKIIGRVRKTLKFKALTEQVEWKEFDLLLDWEKSGRVQKVTLRLYANGAIRNKEGKLLGTWK